MEPDRGVKEVPKMSESGTRGDGKDYDALHTGHCKHSQFQNKESLSTICFPLEMTKKLRQFVASLSEDLSKEPPNTEIVAVTLHTQETTVAHVHVLHDCSWNKGTY